MCTRRRRFSQCVCIISQNVDLPLPAGPMTSCAQRPITRRGRRRHVNLFFLSYLHSSHLMTPSEGGDQEAFVSNR